jgi:TolB-like protein/DNA-binding SARP family transcriptional activator/Tfp pilus assembly protein PilF
MLAADASVTLRLLGGASANGPSGPVLGRGVRGRRLALLSILAVARGRPVGRDKLLALLWPDANTERGRPLLSDALYQVRGTLGDEAVTATGDDLTLNPEALASDVEQFERAVSGGDLEGAVAAYGGPFLDGFHVEDAGEFERWVDGERARLAARYADVLGRLAGACESSGDGAGAVRWLQKLAAHDPYDGRAAARLMQALHASGNRAAALQHARVHAALLRAEFDAEPDETVRALAERLRAEPAPVALLDAAPVPVTPDVPLAPTPPDDLKVGPSPVYHAPLPSRHRHSWAFIATGAAFAVLAPMTLSANLRTGDDATLQPAAVAAAATAHAPSARTAARSIAVLPFEELGPSRASTYFSDGLTEEIIGLLGRVEGLRVAARSSSLALRGVALPAPRIGDTLGVEALLEGSVRRVDGRVRVSARLIDARDGFQRWSNSYDRHESDLIALQNDLASAIVGALQLELDPTSRDAGARTTGSAEVYDLYLRGAFARNKLSGEELRRAADFFERAIRLDSSYAPAWAGLATTLGPLVWYGHMPREEGAPRMRQAARRAVALDSSLVEGHVALGMSHFFVDWNWSGAERAFRRAVALNPNDAAAHHFLANHLRAMGRLDEAIAERTRALSLDPLSVRIGMQLGSDYFVAGELSRSVEQFRRALELEPRSPAVLGEGPQVGFGLGHVLERQGEAAPALREYLRIDSLTGATTRQLQELRRAFDAAGLPGYWRQRAEQVQGTAAGDANPVRLAWMWVRAGERERAIHALERGYRERRMAMVYLAVLPDFVSLADDARVQRLRVAMRFPQAVAR